MYGHPKTPDPWAEVQEIPPYVEPEPSDQSGFVVASLAVALPVFVIAFATGYMAGVFGWL